MISYGKHFAHKSQAERGHSRAARLHMLGSYLLALGMLLASICFFRSAILHLDAASESRASAAALAARRTAYAGSISYAAPQRTPNIRLNPNGRTDKDRVVKRTDPETGTVRVFYTPAGSSRTRLIAYRHPTGTAQTDWNVLLPAIADMSAAV